MSRRQTRDGGQQGGEEEGRVVERRRGGGGARWTAGQPTGAVRAGRRRTVPDSGSVQTKEHGAVMGERLRQRIAAQATPDANGNGHAREGRGAGRRAHVD